MRKGCGIHEPIPRDAWIRAVQATLPPMFQTEVAVPNLASTLREEIARVARRSLRAEIDALRKATAQHRKHVAALKRQLAEQQRQLVSLARRASSQAAAVGAPSSGSHVRFVAKGLRSQRSRLGLSASDFGKLANVSAQTIYNWERETARPGRTQLVRLAALRGLGKREAGRRLELLAADGGAKPRKVRRARSGRP
jgi:DNA-binding transcriptional regulator YiaG